MSEEENLSKMNEIAERADQTANEAMMVVGAFRDELLEEVGRGSIVDSIALNVVASMLVKTLALTLHGNAPNSNEVDLNTVIGACNRAVHKALQEIIQKFTSAGKIVQMSFDASDTPPAIYLQYLKHLIECPLVHYATYVEKNAACEECQKINVLLRSAGLVDEEHFKRVKIVTGN